MMLVLVAARAQTPRLDSSVCSSCHAAISESYRATGMGRSFFRPRPENVIEDYAKPAYDHAASDTYFEMIARDGKYFQRQYQIGFQGKQTNVSETEIDFVLGSGNHARTYLHRTPANQLIELPLGWYAERGGYWAMNPGFDRPDHAGLSRAIPYGCMFCHNAYPQVAAGQGPRADPVFSSVPEGIDCQRCHGDGREHVRLARTAGSRAEALRGAIVNPSRLSVDRQMEICLQCHLEANSLNTSNLIVRYDREPFSYQPGERLADFLLQFDQASAKGREERFQIVGASAYRLRQSQCFLRSRGAMVCTTCHDPHRAVPAADAVRHFSDICLKCHAPRLAALVGARRHPASPDCAGCHMPKRRAQDAVHVVMTDHYIQRRKPERDLVAPMREELVSDNGGDVAPYYPSGPIRAGDELYLGVAQVNVKSNRGSGIALLSAAIEKFRPPEAEFYLQLGDALRASRRYTQAIAPYEEAVRREPQSAAAQERLALAFTRVQQYNKAAERFRKALALAPRDASILKELGLSELEQGRMPEAAAAFEKSLAIDPQQPVAHNGLGGARMKTGDSAGAEAEFREAIRLRPHYAAAHHNIAHLLSSAGRFEEAEYHFNEALRIDDLAPTRFDYALMLARVNRPDEARQQVEAVLRSDPRHAKAHDFLGNLLEGKGQTAEAIEHYRQSVRLDPEYARANLDLGAALAREGHPAAALPFLERAARSPDAAIRDKALDLLKNPR